MRFFAVSFILHLFIIFYFSVFSADEPIQFEKVGNPDVSFSMVEGSTEPVPPKEVEEPIKKKEVVQKVKEEIKEAVIEVPKEEEEKKIES